MKNIIPDENCLTQEQLRRYLDDQCSSEEVRAVDRHLARCPLCSDAVEGMMLLDATARDAALQRIDASIAEKTAPPPLSIRYVRTRRWWLTAAASVAVLVAFGAYWWVEKSVQSQTAVAEMSTLKNVDTAQWAASPSELTAVVTDTDAKTLAKVETREGNRAVSVPVLTDSATKKEQPATAGADVDAIASAEARPVDVVPPPAEAKKEENRQKELAQETINTQRDVANVYSGAAQSNAVRTEQMAKPSPKMAEAAPARAKKKQLSDGTDWIANLRSAFGKGDYVSCRQIGNRILAQYTEGSVYEEGLWILAQSYLKSGDRASAKALLERIVRENGTFRKAAETLLAKEF